MHGQISFRDLEHVRGQNSQGVIVLYSEVEHHHRAIARSGAVFFIFARNLSCGSSGNNVGHETICFRFEALSDRGENGDTKNGHKGSCGVTEGKDGTESYLQKRTEAKECEETELIWNEELFMLRSVVILSGVARW